MKKMILAIVLMVACLSANAQGAKAIYDRFSNLKGVQAVYISPAMFRLAGKLPDNVLEGSEINLKEISDFNGMYVLTIENNQEKGRELVGEAEKLVAKMKYETLMEAKEDGEITRMYSRVVDKDMCHGFLLISNDGDETSYIFIDAVFPIEAISRIGADN